METLKIKRLGQEPALSEQMSESDAASLVTQLYGDRASTLSRLGRGAWSRAYSFTLDEREAVIRFGMHLEDYEKDARAGQFDAPNLPIPEVIALGEAPVGYYAVSERRRGRFFDSLDSSEMRMLLPGLLQTLDAIGDLDVSDTTGYGNWQADGDGPSASWSDALLVVTEDRPRVGKWRQALEQSPVGAATFDAGVNRLKQLLPSLPTRRQMIHQDLFNQNVLVDGDQVTAVLDWGNAWYGDALYDAARIIYFWPWFPNLAEVDIEQAIRRHWDSIGRIPEGADERLQACQLHIGLDHLATTAVRDQLEYLVRSDLQVRNLLHRLSEVWQ